VKQYQNGKVHRGYVFQAYLNLKTAVGDPLVTENLEWRAANNPGSTVLVTKSSGAGIETTDSAGVYLLTLDGTDTALFTAPQIYHELSVTVEDEILLTGILSVVDTLEV
jgi:hypothetical protein